MRTRHHLDTYPSRHTPSIKGLSSVSGAKTRARVCSAPASSSHQGRTRTTPAAPTPGLLPTGFHVSLRSSMRARNPPSCCRWCYRLSSLTSRTPPVAGCSLLLTADLPGRRSRRRARISPLYELMRGRPRAECPMPAARDAVPVDHLGAGGPMRSCRVRPGAYP